MYSLTGHYVRNNREKIILKAGSIEFDTSNFIINDSEFKKIVHLINQNGDTLDYQTEFNIDTTSITLDPDILFTELEIFTLSINSSTLCDSDTNFTAAYNFEYEVADVSPPSFIEDSFGRGNDYVLIQMSENVFSNSVATEPLTVQDFNLEVDYGDLNGAQSIYLESVADTSGGGGSQIGTGTAPLPEEQGFTGNAPQAVG